MIVCDQITLEELKAFLEYLRDFPHKDPMTHSEVKLILSHICERPPLNMMNYPMAMIILKTMLVHPMRHLDRGKLAERLLKIVQEIENTERKKMEVVTKIEYIEPIENRKVFEVLIDDIPF